MKCESVSRSVMSDSTIHGQQPTGFLFPWNSPGKHTGGACHSLLQAIFPTLELNPGLQHNRQILYCLSHQGSWLGCFSVAQCVRHSKGHPLWVLSLLISWHVGRETTVMAASPACDSAVSPYLHDYLTFLQRQSPLQSPPSRPQGPSPCSQQQTSPWDCSPIPTFQLPATMHSRGLALLSGIHMDVSRIICVVLTPFRLSQINCCTL